MISTRKQLYAIFNLFFAQGVFEEVHSAHILWVIWEVDDVLGVDGGDGFGLVVDDFVEGLGEEEARLWVVFGDDVYMDWLSVDNGY